MIVRFDNLMQTYLNTKVQSRGMLKSGLYPGNLQRDDDGAVVVVFVVVVVLKVVDTVEVLQTSMFSFFVQPRVTGSK